MRAALQIALYVVLGVIAVYTVRRYLFTLSRLFGRHRQPYVDIGSAVWPRVAVLVRCHDESAVNPLLEALRASDYPVDKLEIITTRDLDGSAAASTAPVHLIFGADALPGPGLIRQLVAPFFDAEVGAVAGRMVPTNVDGSLLTRLLDLECTGSSQVDQQARMNLGLTPRYDRSVGGVRRTALMDIGGWGDDRHDDTDLTARLMLSGWDIVYQNRSECRGTVAEAWPERIRRLGGEARGGRRALARYWWPLLTRAGQLRRGVALDGVLLLGLFAVGPLLLLAGGLVVALYYLGAPVSSGVMLLLAVAAYSGLGSAAVFQVASGARLDGSRRRIRLLPFLIAGYLVSSFSVFRRAGR